MGRRIVLAMLTLAGALAPCASRAAGLPTDYEAARRMAQESQRLVVAHFWAPWCGPCMRMEREVFSQPSLRAAVEKDFVVVRLNRDNSEALARQFGVTAIPADVILTPQGQIVARLEGFRPADRYANQLGQIAARYREVSEKSVQVAQGAPSGGTAAESFAADAPAEESVEPRPAPLPGRTYRDRPHVAVAERTPPTQAEPREAPPGDEQPSASSPVGPRYAARHAYREKPRVEWDHDAAEASAADSPAPAGPTERAESPVAEAAAPHDVHPAARASSPQSAGVSGRKKPGAWPRLPPGSPPLGLDGYCPVSLNENQAWTRGNVRFGVIHRGRTYLFSSQERQKIFLADPDRYAPALSGDDPVLVVDAGKSIPGSREFGGFHEGRLYLFSSEATLARFDESPERYVAAAWELESQ